MNSKIDIRYLAGLFDGEGCIYFTKRSNNKRETYCQLRIGISNTYKTLMEQLHNEYGGHLRERLSKHKFESGRYRKIGYDLILCNIQAENFLRKCLPYLIIKKERAEIVLDIRKNVSKYKSTGKLIPGEEMEKRKYLVDKLRELNRKGVSSLEFRKQLACIEC